MNDVLREKLAASQHSIWSHWNKFMFTQGTMNEDGSFTIPTEKVIRWTRQMNTDYYDLSENERESDRNQADKIIEVLKANGIITSENQKEVQPVITDSAFVVLLLLQMNGRSHPYQIMEDSLNLIGVRIPVATMYRTIAQLQKNGLINRVTSEQREHNNQKRDYYEITEKGRQEAILYAQRLTKLYEAAKLAGFLV